MKFSTRLISGIYFIILLLPVSQAQQAGSVTDELLVEYPASFFNRYQPATALDMVRQVPGFQLDDGNSDRGFIAAVGNVLINDIYPSAKQDTPSSILARIPASQVARVELLRGQVRGIDLQGQSEVVNVVLREDTPAVVRWDIYTRHHSEGPMKPGVDLSLSDRVGNLEYNAGVRIEREANGENGYDALFDANNVLQEDATVSQDSTGIDLTATLNASTLLGETLVQVNSRAHYETRNPLEITTVTPRAPGNEAREELVGTNLDIKQFEIGGDALRNIGTDLVGKGIFVFFIEGLPSVNTREVFDAGGNRTIHRIAEGNAVSTEAIARLEFDWKGIERHNVQVNAEVAYNSLDGSLEQTVDNGTGPVLVDVPGANTLVEEIRGDFLLKDTWVLGDFEFDYGLGAEISNISQSGDAEQERDFFFVKPQAILTYSPRRESQTRLSLVRQVSQLNFNDFVSATDFDDDDVALGNPNLRPDTTWVAKLSHERRFGRDSVVSIAAFHHWISNVLDLLPLTENFEAPGNIGNGRRWGVEVEGSFPLDWLGLASSKLDINLLLQDTTVVDPVTGLDRSLSGRAGPNAYRSLVNQNANIKYLYRFNFRQDLEHMRIAWGWSLAERSRRTRYRVNELDVHYEGYAVDMFIETTRWQGLKVSLVGDNLLNYDTTRDRTSYTGLRGLSPVESRQIQDRLSGRRFTLTVSGIF